MKKSAFFGSALLAFNLIGLPSLLLAAQVDINVELSQPEQGDLRVCITPWQVTVYEEDEVHWIFTDPENLLRAVAVNARDKDCGEAPFPSGGRLDLADDSGGQKEIVLRNFRRTPAHFRWCRYNIDIRLQNNDVIIVDPDYRVEPDRRPSE